MRQGYSKVYKNLTFIEVTQLDMKTKTTKKKHRLEDS